MCSIKKSNIIGALFLMTASLFSLARADVLTAIVNPPNAASADAFHLGTARNPAGITITADRRSLRLNGQPWTPVMGEFHYTRYAAAEWRDELLKMKAGGI